VPFDAGAPETNITLAVELRDFIGDEPPPGEIFPSHTRNPLLLGMILAHGEGAAAAEASGDWLLDTGAGSSFISFAMAKAVGLIPSQYATLEAYLVDHDGPIIEVGGIGPKRQAPLLQVREIRAPAKEGFQIAWQNVNILVADVAGLDGIFGMNLLVSAATPDPDDPTMSWLFDQSPRLFGPIVFDPRPENPELRLFFGPLVGGYAGWADRRFGSEAGTIGAAEADADGDGSPNFLEYALGGDPLVPSSARLPQATLVSSDGDEHLALRYWRPASIEGIDYLVEASSDLVNWYPAEAEPHSEALEGSLLRMEFRLPTPFYSQPNEFLRLRAVATD
jgi:hypothetical protein